MNTNSNQIQLEICYPNEMTWYAVEPKKLIFLSIGGLEKDARLALKYFASEGGLYKKTMNSLIPNFSNLSQPFKEIYQQMIWQEEAAKYICDEGIKDNLNTIIFPSAANPELAKIIGVQRLQFMIGLLCSVPDGKERKIFIIEDYGGISKCVRVKKETGEY